MVLVSFVFIDIPYNHRRRNHPLFPNLLCLCHFYDCYYRIFIAHRAYGLV
jgi:hypothetical protein